MTSATALKDVLTTARELELGAYLVALDASGLLSALQEKGPITVFIPTDAAFQRFSKKQLQALIAEPAALERLMKYTIVRGALTRDALNRLDAVETLGGERLEITSVGGGEVDGIPILTADVECSNGIVHLLDEAPIPPSLRTRFGKNVGDEEKNDEKETTNSKIDSESESEAEKFERKIREKANEERLYAPTIELPDETSRNDV